jgi:hypothetical protein
MIFTNVSVWDPLSELLLEETAEETVLPAGVKSSGNSENTPAQLASRKVRKYA